MKILNMNWKIWRKVLLVVMMLVSCGFITWRMVGHWNEVNWSLLRFSPVPFILSFVLYFSVWELVRGYKLKILYSVFGYSVKWWDSILINSATRVAKYIPGGVWFATAKALVAERFAIPKLTTFTSMIVDLGFLLSGACVLLAVTVIQNHMLGFFVAVSCVLIAPVAAILTLKVLRRVWPNRVSRIQPTYVRLLLLSCLYVVTWAIQTVALYFLVVSFYPTGLWALPSMASAWSISWMVGLIAPFAPGGLGVREALFTQMLSSTFPVAICGLIAIVSRFWLILCELISSVVAWICLKARK